MSEYWVSRKKYFCTYCEIYIADDAPSRTQHESGLRHKGNRERFVRNLYKQGERKKKDLEEEKRELARVEQAANEAYAQDIAAGHATASSTSRLPVPPPVASSPKKPERPGSVWSNYSTAQSLGYVDPEEERMREEMALRQAQGIVGEWQVVAPPPPPLPEEEGEEKDVKSDDLRNDSLASRKREAQSYVDDAEDARYFKLRKRTLGAGFDEIWDPGDIQVKTRSTPKEESSTSEADFTKSLSSAVIGGEAHQAPDSSTEVPRRWKPMKWKHVSDEDWNHDGSPPIKEEPTDHVAGKAEETIVKEEPDAAPKFLDEGNAVRDLGLVGNHETKPVKAEDEEEKLAITPEPSPALFKKRKVPIGVRGRR